ncbi:MAG TPA: PadR family transcriptional regulator [Lachnospiraceae bacterium]|nr:PadR family transcriptional regulator [Lachnospiraceae bacterium]
MNMKYALLGTLFSTPQSGHELKRSLVNSPLAPVSDTDLSIYRILLQLTREGLICSSLQTEEHRKTKTYHITDNGRQTLKDWVLSSPHAPVFMNPFMARFLSADLLNAKELEALLQKYETNLKLQILMRQESLRRFEEKNGRHSQDKLPVLMKRILDLYKNELEWINCLQAVANNDRKEPAYEQDNI